jgi:putative lipoprotein (rSAM/lipoprotein system)
MLVLVSLMALSCSKEQIGDPYMLFEIHGTVMDAEGNPIEGIQVTSGLSDAQTTNVNGNFSFYGRSTPTTYVVLSFEDKDGAENGGIFVKRSIEVQVHEKTQGSEMGNFRGTYFASEVEVVMVKKEDALNPDSGLIPLCASAE